MTSVHWNKKKMFYYQLILDIIYADNSHYFHLLLSAQEDHVYCWVLGEEKILLWQ